MFSWSHDVQVSYIGNEMLMKRREMRMKGTWKDNERKWEEMKGEWKEHERTMKGNERKWKENERNMKGQWKEMRGNERRMKGTWKQMNPKVWVLIPFDVVRYVVRTSFGRRSKQLTVSLQNATGKIYMWWITGVPIWHECFLLYLIPLWRCFGSCVHEVFPHLSHSKTCQNRVCRTSASHWGWPCFWSTYLTSWSNGVPMRFDTILLDIFARRIRGLGPKGCNTFFHLCGKHNYKPHMASNDFEPMYNRRIVYTYANSTNVYTYIDSHYMYIH